MSQYDFMNQDRRILEKKLRAHEMSQAEYQKHLKTLTDENEHGEELVVCTEEFETEVQK